MRLTFVVIALLFSCQLFGQLSDGEGKLIRVQEGSIEMYLPNYFEINANPPGVIHKVSNTMILVIKVPKEQQGSINEGKGRDFLVDKRMSAVVFQKKNGNQYGRKSDLEIDYMEYELQGIQFERINSYVRHKDNIYLLMANYPVVIKDQVEEEVKKVYQSIRFLK